MAGSKGGSFQVSGLADVFKALDALPRRLQTKVIVQAEKHALQPVKQRCQELAPSGPTGETKRNIRVVAGRTKGGRISCRVVIGKQFYTGKAFHAAFPEFGTNRQHAQHFMKRGFDQTKDKAKRDVIEAIKLGVEAESK